jgi:hypothetical protein
MYSPLAVVRLVFGEHLSTPLVACVAKAIAKS